MQRIEPGSPVVLRRPRALRGTSAVVRRPVAGGWEVEYRSALGTPMHLVASERDLQRSAA